jgi:hypothetical protein
MKTHYASLCVFSPLPPLSLSLSLSLSHPVESSPSCSHKPYLPSTSTTTNSKPSTPTTLQPSPLLSPRETGAKTKNNSPPATRRIATKLANPWKSSVLVHRRHFSSIRIVSRPFSYVCAFWSNVDNSCRSSSFVDSESRYVQTGDVSEKVRGRRAVPGPVPSVFARDVRHVGYDLWLLGQ